jgi:hypothetical protein
MTETLKLPKEVVKSDWEDDVDLDYETYGTNKQEMEYISPDKVSKESLESIKNRKIGQNILNILSKNAA